MNDSDIFELTIATTDARLILRHEFLSAHGEVDWASIALDVETDPAWTTEEAAFVLPHPVRFLDSN
jgi:23S rRNA maturation-related 3'-5' exoribonuclease YhaM